MQMNLKAKILDLRNLRSQTQKGFETSIESQIDVLLAELARVEAANQEANQELEARIEARLKEFESNPPQHFSHQVLGENRA
jgi:uncharacterized protein YicC (UPF0701 family)